MLNQVFKSNSNQKEIFKKSFYVFIIRVLGYFCGFLFFWIVANKYGTKIQGIFSLAFLAPRCSGDVRKSSKIS